MSNVIVTVTPGTNTVQVAPSIAVATGPGVPTGGTAGQVLTKQSSDPRDTAWQDPFELDITALAAEWNDGGTDFTGIGLDITDTASGAGSKLLDLKVGGASRFNVNKGGGLTLTHPSGSSGGIRPDGSYRGTFLLNEGSDSLIFDNAETRLRSGGAFSWSSNATFPEITSDLRLYRDAADTLAQRRGTNPQTQRWYGSYTDASNNEGFEIVTQAGDTLLRTFANGTGTQRNLVLNSRESTLAGGVLVNLQQGSNTVRLFQGDFYPAIGSISLGRSSNPWRDLFLRDAANLLFGADTGLARDSAGVVKVTDGGAGLGDLVADRFNLTSSGTGIYSRAPTLRVNFAIDGNDSGIEIGPSILALANTSALAWTGDLLPSAAPDLFLARDAANTLALRNGLEPQAFNVYNTYTDASNYERGFARWNSNVFEIGTEAAGTGSNRNTRIFGGGAHVITIAASAVEILKPLRTNDNHVEFTEMTPPSTPSANTVRFYAKDNGAGKTQLVVLMPDGVETVLATET